MPERRLAWKTAVVYRFGSYLLDPTGRELALDGEPVHLEPQAFDLLVFLVEQRDRVVPKVDLLDGVWGHGFLSDANLTTRIKEARRAIGDDGTLQHSIRNVRGRGYRFVAPVTVVEAGRTRGLRSALLGREAILATTVDLLASSALVTLTGPGGVGKSTLARAVAARAASSCTDGAHVVELEALVAGTAVLPAVARRLDLVVDHNPDAALHVIARLDALLVLDSCEHVVDEAAELVDALLAIPDGALRILATSQVRLGCSAEAVVRLDALEVEPGRELFTARARAARPSWDDTAVDAERIDRLVAQLDRLPLAIEMAAARLDSMTLDDLEEAISSGASLLQLHHRAPARRHRSLESVVDWSVALLEPAERAVLDGFSVFAGPVTATDAGAVLDPESAGRVRPALAALAERSLLVADVEAPAARYSMLATIRAASSQRLTASGADQDLRGRHAAHFAAVTETTDDLARTPQEPAGRARLDSVIDEVRRAHRWARRHDPVLASRLSAALFHVAHSSLWFEPAAWAQELLAEQPDVLGDQLHGARLATAGAAAHRGHLALARAHCRAVASTATGRVRAIALELLADVAMYEGDLPAVGRAADELGRLGDALGDAHVATTARVDASLARSYAGDPDGALTALTDIDMGPLAPTDAAWVAYARGEALSSGGDPGAASCYREAIDLGGPVGSQFVVSVARTSLATALARAGDHPAALAASADALADFLRHGNHTHALTAMRNLVGLLAAVGDDRGAVALGAATTHDRARASYGVEGAELVEVLDSVRLRAGEVRFAEWSAQGRGLDIDQSLRTAIGLVAAHRH